MNMHNPRLPAGHREYGRKDAGGGDEPGLAQLQGEMSRILNEVKGFAEKAGAEVKANGDMTKATKEKVDEALLKFGETTQKLQEAGDRIADIEQKLARRGNPEAAASERSLGQAVIESEAFKAGGMTSASRMSLRVKMDRKDITSANTTVGAGRSPGNSLVPADRQAGIVAPPQRRMTIRDLLLPGETASSNIEYVQETGFTNNAAMVAEGAAKPKSDLTFDLKNAPVRTLAHIFKASRQIMDDAPALRSYIDGRARYGLEFREEVQLLTGDGTGQNILGLQTQATAFAVPSGMAAVANMTAIDRLRIAILQVVLAEYPASAFVLNPIDWATIELTKDTQGRYIIGDPAEGTAPRLWNLPVVATQAQAQNRFLTGAFDIAAQIFDRMEIEVLLSTENVDDFEKNMMTLRAEERLALAVYRPEAFVTGLLVTA